MSLSPVPWITRVIALGGRSRPMNHYGRVAGYLKLLPSTAR